MKKVIFNLTRVRAAIKNGEMQQQVDRLVASREKALDALEQEPCAVLQKAINRYTGLVMAFLEKYSDFSATVMIGDLYPLCKHEIVDVSDFVNLVRRMFNENDYTPPIVTQRRMTVFLSDYRFNP